MRILVTGAGRGGTYLLKAAVESFGNLTFKKGEDKQFFRKNIPENYGAKLTTENIDVTATNLAMKLHEYPDLRIIFSSRHPVDILLSRLWRGQNLAGDRDAIERAIEAIRFFYGTYSDTICHFSGRTFIVKMSDLINSTEFAIKGIANFLGWSVSYAALNFVAFTNHKRHIERYGKKLDPSQIDVHLNWETAYDGFFKDRRADIVEAEDRLADVIKGLSY